MLTAAAVPTPYAATVSNVEYATVLRKRCRFFFGGGPPGVDAEGFRSTALGAGEDVGGSGLSAVVYD